MRRIRTASTIILALALIVLGGGAIQLAQTAHADPASPHFRVDPRRASATGGSDLTITPQTLAGITFTTLDSKHYHTVALDSDSKAYSWGDNSFGQLGDGSTTAHLKPAPITMPANTKFVEVSAGYDQHSLALDDKGNVYAWGRNDKGQLGLGDTTNRSLPTLVPPPAGVNKFTHVNAADAYSQAIGDDGRVYAWGNNDDFFNGWDFGEPTGNGQLGVGDTAMRLRPTPVVGIPSGVRITSLQAPYLASMALGDNGVVYVWGSNYHGQMANGGIRGYSATARAINPPAGYRFTSIVSGNWTDYATASNGKTYLWGATQWGQIGDGTLTTSSTTGQYVSPVAVNVSMPAGVTIKSMARGGWHTLAIGSDGKVYTWGQNWWGALGIAGFPSGNYMYAATTPSLVTVPAGITFTKVFASDVSSFAIGSDGNTYAWGRNDNGQLGDGKVVAYYDSAVRVGGAVNIDKVTIDGVTTSGTKNPTTYAWSGKVPAGTPGTTVDIKVDWSLVGLGTQPSETYQLHYLDLYTVQFKLGGAPGTAPPDQQIEEDSGKTLDWPTTPAWEHHWFTGWYTDTGEPWDFGDTVDHNMTLTAGWEEYKFTLSPIYGPSKGGDLVNIGAPDPPSTITYSQVAAGSSHSLAIGSDGNAYSWGGNERGVLGQGHGDNKPHSAPGRVHLPDSVRALKVSAGANHSLAIGSDHHVYAWGSNNAGQLGNGNTSAQDTPIDLTALGKLPTTITQVAAGTDYSLAVSSNGHVYAWGFNASGQLGISTNAGTYMPVLNPVDISAAGSLPSSIRKLAAGTNHALAVSGSGHVYAWGSNEFAQLGTTTGLGTSDAQFTPVDISAAGGLPANIVHVAAGDQHSLALASDGHLYTWGNNNLGQLGHNHTISTDPTPTDLTSASGLPASISAINAGGSFSAALANNGHVYTWGDNAKGQLGNDNTSITSSNSPNDLTASALLPECKRIGTGDSHAMAISRNHHTYTWGGNTLGKLGQGNDDADPHPKPAEASALQKLTVTGLTMRTTDTDTPVWNSNTNSWQTHTAPNPAGTTNTNIHWSLGGYSQPDYTLNYTYHYTLPAAGTIPLQRISASLALTLGLSASFAYAAYVAQRKKRANTKLSRA
ncbi:hypothetical protein KIMH_05960 [Bombiscardovia apis]|uniref:RCC1-like domain-containing protein n=1 Tax=Bombiscardovia apis TaxID=2932182 RepID=A0ABN6SIJ2_9BIFI|nr:InlB B-repeat-containing protein [Bombiscardovia apis]BDR54485.1 hypothetical protein KIMH_05960 [Bombiscardovia apis]